MYGQRSGYRPPRRIPSTEPSALCASGWRRQSIVEHVTGNRRRQAAARADSRPWLMGRRAGHVPTGVCTCRAQLTENNGAGLRLGTATLRGVNGKRNGTRRTENGGIRSKEQTVDGEGAREFCQSSEMPREISIYMYMSEDGWLDCK